MKQELFYTYQELLNEYVGERALAVRTIFSRARTFSPCTIFFDQVDALTYKRGKEVGWAVERVFDQSSDITAFLSPHSPLPKEGDLIEEHEKEGVSVVDRVLDQVRRYILKSDDIPFQLLIELDGLEEQTGFYVIGATTRPDIVDRAVLQPGSFGELVYVPLPSPNERGMILKALERKKQININVDLMALGKDDACRNLSGADLNALINVCLPNLAGFCLATLLDTTSKRCTIYGKYIEGGWFFIPEMMEVNSRTSCCNEKRPSENCTPPGEQEQPVKNSTNTSAFINHAAIAWDESRRKWIGDLSWRPLKIPKDPIIRFLMH